MEDNKVAVLLEDLLSRFRTFGEGLQILNDKVDKIDTELQEVREDVQNLKLENRLEHQQLRQMIQELNTEVVQN